MPKYQMLPAKRIQTEGLDSTFRSLVKQAEQRQEVARVEPDGRVSAPRLTEEQLYAGQGVRKLGNTGSGYAYQSDVYSGSEFMMPPIKNPLLSPTNFYLPHSLIELNAWIRYFDRFHPIVGNAIDMHSTVPFSRFQLTGIGDSHVQQFYEDMCDELNLFRRILEVSREYELIGEAFPFAYWDEEMNAFSDITILNPDYVEVRGLKIAGAKGLRYELVVGEELRQFIMSEDPLDWEIVHELDPALVRAAESGLNAPLDPFNLSHLARLGSPYDMRGTSIILGCVKDLLYEEQLREAQYAVAGGIIRPREIWKLGVKNEYMPTDGDLQDLRRLLRSAEYDPNFAIISHHGLAVDFVGADRRMLPLDREYAELEKRILTRLYTSRAMTHGEGPTYSNASVAMKILDARYATKRDFIIDWVRNSIFLPVALANEFYKPVKRELAFQYRVANREREVIIPEFKWLSLVNLVERQQQIQYAIQLSQKAQMPMKIICDLLQLDYDEVKDYLRKEQGTVVDPVWQEVRKQTATAAARAAGTGGAVSSGGGGGLPPGKPPGGTKQLPEGKGDDREKIEKEVEQQAEKDSDEVDKGLERAADEAKEVHEKPAPVQPEPKTFELKKKETLNILSGTEQLGRIPKEADHLLKDFSPDDTED